MTAVLLAWWFITWSPSYPPWYGITQTHGPFATEHGCETMALLWKDAKGGSEKITRPCFDPER